MPMHIEQLTEYDKTIIEKKTKHNTIVVILGIVVMALILYFSIFSCDCALTPIALGVPGIIFGIFFILPIAAFFLIREKTQSDLLSGTKEVYIGPVIKESTVRSRYLFFIIDGIKFQVTWKIYKQYKNDDIVRIERLQTSHHLLGVYSHETEPNKTYSTDKNKAYRFRRNVATLILIAIILSANILHKEYWLSKMKSIALYNFVLVIYCVTFLIMLLSILLHIKYRKK